MAPPIPRLLNSPQSIPTPTPPKQVTCSGKLAKLASAIPAAFSRTRPARIETQRRTGSSAPAWMFLLTWQSEEPLLGMIISFSPTTRNRITVQGGKRRQQQARMEKGEQGQGMEGSPPGATARSNTTCKSQKQKLGFFPTLPQTVCGRTQSLTSLSVHPRRALRQLANQVDLVVVVLVLIVGRGGQASTVKLGLGRGRDCVVEVVSVAVGMLANMSLGMFLSTPRNSHRRQATRLASAPSGLTRLLSTR